MILIIIALLLNTLEERIEQLFQGRESNLKAEMHDLVIHELAHARRLQDARDRGTLDAAREAANSAKPGVVMNAAGKKLTEPAAWTSLRRATFVYFAETHDSVVDHNLQLEALRQLDTGNGDLSVGFEMFPRTLQPVLDDWVAGKLSEWEFLEKANWYRSWGFPYPLFRPIFLHCRDHSIPMVALYAPSEITRKVGRSGLRSLTDEERAQLAVEIRLTDAAHRRNFDEIFPHHPGINLAFFYEAFCAWDDTMAESAAAWNTAKGGRMLVIAGSGHIRGRAGIPARVRRRTGKPYRILLTRAVGEPDDNFDLMLNPGADIVWWTEESHASPRPKLGLATDPALKVTMIAPGSAAEAAGAKVGDVLKRAGKRELTQTESIRHFLELRTKPDFTLVVERDGKEVRLKVTVPLDPDRD